MALHNYIDTHGVLPPGYVQLGNPGPDSNQFSWITMLLPFIDQAAMYNKINWSIPSGQTSTTGANSANFPIVSQPLSVFTCPSDVAPGGLAWGLFARGNYAGSNGMGPQRYVGEVGFENTLLRSDAGPFEVDSSTRPRDFTDGMSNSILVAEIRKGGTGGGHANDIRGNMHNNEGPLMHFDYTPNASSPDGIRTSGCTSTTSMPCTGTYDEWDKLKITLTARSLHTGGVQVLLADGSCRFISNNLNLTTWQNLGLHRDGNVVGEF